MSWKETHFKGNLINNDSSIIYNKKYFNAMESSINILLNTQFIMNLHWKSKIIY